MIVSGGWMSNGVHDGGGHWLNGVGGWQMSADE